MTELLDVQELHIHFSGARGISHAVRGVSFQLARGEKLGIVGESGSGKSQTARALLKITARGGTVSARRLDFAGTDLLAASERQMQQIRGRRISMILQDPKFSLNPLMRVGEQIAETWRLHHPRARGEARQRSLAMLEAVHIRDPERVYRLYPHEVSGGMGQRIMIAMMLITEPELIIADEPTSALDVTVRRQILGILDELLQRQGSSLLLISHDLDLVAGFCDRILVMYAGRVVEQLPASQLQQARHPYTRALLASRPSLEYPQELLPVPQRTPEWLLPLEEQP
ncbi:ABC transporter ATP-binding protein [Stutzerimonas kirkiae]|uniref:ABC-type dipeptide transporter n=1 Tax=Stutzerimonas kirkiae TaxID=2211392 RepID=A0A4Q9R7E3_9GAMM|nr:ABC transporter ATP-binding protein [Stutzerimonas kirkiae]TBU96532.1 peptide ABC transporter ATP-binding protein [Stutzerimonas kirkiae]TBV02185.1 peptide ABC transporter ATP-binding protein [Stutzerimonas kirkiae]TBV08854.1 peptide ABC transporter ATP-binding protein [Stutzerimonas kirkiae]TBV15690.1 peptide ABC transporter ATP-binding protein [Stutzerimonas kirkiae]